VTTTWTAIEDHTIYVVVDPDNLVAESNENNNNVASKEISGGQVLLEQDFEDAYLIDDFEDISDWSASPESVGFITLNKDADSTVDSYAMKITVTLEGAGQHSYTFFAKKTFATPVDWTGKETLYFFHKETTGCWPYIIVADDVGNSWSKTFASSTSYVRDSATISGIDMSKIKYIYIGFCRPGGLLENDYIFYDQCFVCKSEILGEDTYNTGHITTKSHTGNYGLGVTTNSGGGRIFYPCSEKQFFAECYMKNTKTVYFGSEFAVDGSDPLGMAITMIAENSILYWDGQEKKIVKPAVVDTFYHIKIFSDFTIGKWTLWVDDELISDNLAFTSQSVNPEHICFIGNTYMVVDDLKAYTLGGGEEIFLEQDFEQAYLIDDFEDISDWNMYVSYAKSSDSAVDSFSLNFAPPNSGGLLWDAGEKTFSLPLDISGYDKLVFFAKETTIGGSIGILFSDGQQGQVLPVGGAFLGNSWVRYEGKISDISIDKTHIVSIVIKYVTVQPGCQFYL
jgi:hypothetical protein